MLTAACSFDRKNIALIDGDSSYSITYDDLQKRIDKYKKLLGDKKALVFCLCKNDISSIAAYLAILQNEHVLLLLDRKIPGDTLKRLTDLYRPNFVIDPEREECFRYENTRADLHPELKLLLSTSGTTASPKLIRLSLKNLLSNAKAIVKYLAIDQNERAIASLPMHYSFGLSVINTHILQGASLVLTSSGIVQTPFWKIFNRYGCTSLAGVPYTYQILSRLHIERFDLPTLKTMTQAGGKLADSLIEKFWHYMKKKRGRFFVMYGQTEATARIAYLSPEFLPAKLGSVGKPIEGGRLQIKENNGEIIYFGDNVMLGYAKERADLAKGDELKGTLSTGDLGYMDKEGFLFITGRSKRISKVYGLRINLDEMEENLNLSFPFAITESNEKIVIHLEQKHANRFPACVRKLAASYKLHRNTFALAKVDKLPRNACGKIEYAKLRN